MPRRDGSGIERRSPEGAAHFHLVESNLSWDRVAIGWERNTDLSSRRLAYQKEQQWPVPEIWDSLRPALLVFLDHVDAGAVCDDFVQRGNRALATAAIVRDA